MKLSLALAITLFGLVALHWAEAGTMDSSCRSVGNSNPAFSDSFCCGCQTWERKIWREACKGQGGLGGPKGDSRDPCITCYKKKSIIINRVSTSVWCANQEKPKVFKILDGKQYKTNEGRVYCLKQGAKMGRLRKGQKWPKHNKFLEKIAQCPPY